jgi:hypothetical protein
MDEGYIVDNASGIWVQSEWVEGPPQTSVWGLKLRGKQRRRVMTFRCPGCGYLESYAKGDEG